MMRVLRAVYRLYPRWWWRRYGAELEALVDDDGARWTTIADLAFGAVCVRLRQSAPGRSTASRLFWSPSGFAPVAMSAAALAMIAGHMLNSGVAPQSDEGTAAHLWQLLMACQLPLVALFPFRWIPQHGRSAIAISAIHVGAMSAALFPVWWFKW
ncbi:MAG: hypothetical protein ABI051_16880 [Vicinamibacterales bacterium]